MQRKAENKVLRRLAFVATALGVVAFSVIVVRLFKLQVVDYAFYQEKAINQQTKDKTIYPARGTIFDRNMKPLAISASTEFVTIEAVKIDNDQQGELIAKELSRILNLDYDSVLKKVQTKATYAVLKRGVEKDVADQVRKFISDNKIDSVFLNADSTRYYPYGNFLSNVLGFVGSDEQGLYGLEVQYEKELTGKPGRVVTAVNAKGDAMAFDYEMYYEAEDGNSLVLSIDQVLQHYLEKNLEVAVLDNKVQNRAVGIVMDVKTGGILAMATKPDFNPNDPFTIADNAVAQTINSITDKDQKKAAQQKALNDQWLNKAITDTYSPGSTFKLLTASMALEEKTSSLNSTYYCPGFKMIGNRRISCWKVGGHGSETFAEALQDSCNVSFMDIGGNVGIPNFTKYYNAFGLREKAGIDLPGEAVGSFWSKMSETDLAVASFGQNFTITPLQMITAVSAIANGGTLYQPYVVSEIVDPQGNIVQKKEPQAKRQVISTDTSKILRELAESVVTVGTGKNAYTAGYRVAGKTATSEKTEKKTQTGQEYYISSFIAFAPADDPQIAVLIMLDEPNVYPYTGGITVAPVIRRFMEEALPYLNVEPVYTEQELEQKEVTIPDLTGLTLDQAKSTLSSLGVQYETNGGGDKVTDQMPAPGAIVSKSTKVILYMGGAKPKKMITVPDLRGMSVDKVKQTLNNIGLYMKTEGILSAEGGQIAAVKQSIAFGEQVEIGTVLTVEFSDLTQTSE